MQRLLPLLLAIFACLGAPAAAQQYAAMQQYVIVETVVIEWVEVGASRATPFHGAPAMRPAIATYGAFRVLDDGTAALVGTTGAASPGNFNRMLRDYPGLKTLEMIECPGTEDDVANLEVGRMIREAGLTTHVPANGSVRSGAVELFLSGANRTLADGARFAVHSWVDDLGQQADDYADNAPIHREYLGFYQEMGFSAEDARAFYDMTNSVPHETALWLTAQDMRKWLGQDDEAVAATPSVAAPVLGTSGVAETDPEIEAAPRLAYLDLAAVTF